MEPDISIVCPQCAEKAAYYSDKVIRDLNTVPNIEGRIACSNCGLNSVHQFKQSDHFYKIPVGGRYLFARTIARVAELHDYFKSGQKRKSDPELDFPREFYLHRKHIAAQLNKLLSSEPSTR